MGFSEFCEEHEEQYCLDALKNPEIENKDVWMEEKYADYASEIEDRQHDEIRDERLGL
jgi:hypothetical protein